jgi:hypothetical protein
MDDFDQDYKPVYIEYGDDDFEQGYAPRAKKKETDPLAGWHKSRNKARNICKYIHGVGLCTIFPWGNEYKIVAAGQFYGPYPTQEAAQLAAKSLNQEFHR